MNRRTVFPFQNWFPGRPVSARTMFLEQYALLRRWLEHDALGVLFAAFHESSPLCMYWLPAAPHRTTAAIVGRHTRAAVRIPSAFETVSLRHLGILCRAISTDEVRIRVLDLATDSGFSDENGRTLRSIAAEGPVFLWMGPVLLMVLVTGPLAPSGESAAEAYDCIPERVYIQEDQSGVLWRRPDLQSRRDSRITIMPDPVVSGPLLIDQDEEPAGRLFLSSGGQTTVRRVGARALERGVLLGRYERCQLHSGDDRLISRVHLMLVRDGKDLVAFDTASTNGVSTPEGEPVRLRGIRSGESLVLPGGAVLRWEGI